MVLAGVVSPVTLRRWLKEPLVHFLGAGAVLFLLAGAWGDDRADGSTIRVGRDDLLAFMQGRAQVYDEAAFSALLANLAPEERARLVRDAALQEALYREGKALGLAEADPLIRQRIVQQMRLLLMEEAAADLSVSDGEVRSFFERNRQDYALPASLTFTHVFVPGTSSRAQADALLRRLRSTSVPFEQAGKFGERFLYQTNYVDVGPSLVASHFGKEFASRLSGLPEQQWVGPVRSDHGWHLVLVSDSTPARLPAYADIAAKVREDALSEKRQLAAEQALNRMLERYRVEAGGDLG